jgi:5'-nucleotidase
MSGAITSDRPLTYSLKHKENGLTIYSCTGTPVDCVKLALNEVLDRMPDLLVSGINHGGNHAICVHYSGTLGAAIEGCIFHVPSIGVSLMDHAPDADFSEACRLSVLLAEKVLKEGLPHGTYLNLNVPAVVPVKGLAVCRQADGQWINEFDPKKGADGKMEYWLQGDYIDHEPVCPDNDTNRLNEGYASLVPCTIDATDHAFKERLKQWNITL